MYSLLSSVTGCESLPYGQVHCYGQSNKETDTEKFSAQIRLQINLLVIWYNHWKWSGEHYYTTL